MTNQSGRQYVAIPGPSVMPDRVLTAMHRGAPDIYDVALEEMVETLVSDLKGLAGTKGDLAIYIANGHGVWEAAIANTLQRGDKVLVLATGAFGFGWADMAAALGADCEIMDFGKRSPVDMDRVLDRLRADKDHEFKAVMITHVDTATSVRNDLPALRRVLDTAGHPALLMADCVASFACEEFHMDAWGVDLAVTACQKGLMTPPGMGFVFFNERANALRDKIDVVSRYWNWNLRVRPDEFYLYFGGTAPTHHLYGLQEALKMIAEEGLEKVWKRHACLASAYWAAVECWGQGGSMQLNINEKTIRSHAVTAIGTDAPFAKDLRRWVESNAGVNLGIGLGMAAADDPARHGFFRIGHMGHVNAHMVMGVIGSIDAGLKALNIPHGPGASEAAAAVIAGSSG